MVHHVLRCGQDPPWRNCLHSRARCFPLDNFPSCGWRFVSVQNQLIPVALPLNYRFSLINGIVACVRGISNLPNFPRFHRRPYWFSSPGRWKVRRWKLVKTSFLGRKSFKVAFKVLLSARSNGKWWKNRKYVDTSEIEWLRIKRAESSEQWRSRKILIFLWFRVLLVSYLLILTHHSNLFIEWFGFCHFRVFLRWTWQIYNLSEPPPTNKIFPTIFR